MRMTTLNVATQSSMASVHKRFNEEGKLVEAHEIINKIFKEVLG